MSTLPKGCTELPTPMPLKRAAKSATGIIPNYVGLGTLAGRSAVCFVDEVSGKAFVLDARLAKSFGALLVHAAETALKQAGRGVQ